MRVTVVCASNRQPAWVTAGCADYARRIAGGWRLEIREIALAKRGAARPAGQALDDEGRRLLAAVPKGARIVALDVAGAQWSTAELAERLRAWSAQGAPVALLIGGPDGLAAACLERAAERWSLSRLTLPHGLARVLTAEAVYRAWSVIAGHPYHRV